MKLLVVIGARPQFIKHYPFEKEAKKHFEVVTVHTGQHYDENMSKVFFDQLGMRSPDYLLELGGGGHGTQTGKMMIEIERIVQDEKPNAIVVYGDTNSTLAGALVGSKLHIPIVHIEAGLRSYNKEMPEEINRVLTDHVSQLLLIPSESSRENLSLEGIHEGVETVGDIMKDALLECQDVYVNLSNEYQNEPYCYVTLHRPYNVDEQERLVYVLNSLAEIDMKVVFAMHPRTRKRIEEFGIDMSRMQNIKVIAPQSYFNNLNLLYYSKCLITDSGGMQKEAYWLRKPCVTVRKETEWKETLSDGANTLVFEDLSKLKESVMNSTMKFDEKLYGDGRTSKIICEYISKYFKR